MQKNTVKHRENTVRHCGTKKEINVTEYDTEYKKHRENTVRHCGTKNNK